jgi:Tfp pilus assembly protein PilF
MGVALAATGKDQRGDREYKKSLSMNNDSSQTHNNLGSALAEAGQLDEAWLRFKSHRAEPRQRLGAHQPAAIFLRSWAVIARKPSMN